MLILKSNNVKLTFYFTSYLIAQLMNHYKLTIVNQTEARRQFIKKGYGLLNMFSLSDNEISCGQASLVQVNADEQKFRKEEKGYRKK